MAGGAWHGVGSSTGLLRPSVAQSSNPGLKPFCCHFLDAATARSMTVGGHGMTRCSPHGSGGHGMTRCSRHDSGCVATFQARPDAVERFVAHDVFLCKGFSDQCPANAPSARAGRCVRPGRDRPAGPWRLRDQLARRLKVLGLEIHARKCALQLTAWRVDIPGYQVSSVQRWLRNDNNNGFRLVQAPQVPEWPRLGLRPE